MTAVLEPPANVVGTPTIVDAVTRFQAGDTAAFDTIYCAYRLMIFKFVLKRLSGPGRPDLADDLTADTFERAFKRLRGGFVWQGHDLGAWLVTIARNIVADHYKSGHARLSTVMDPLTMRDFGMPAGCGPFSDDLVADEQPEEVTLDYLRGVELAAAMRELSDEQREVLTLRFYRQLPVAHVARIMGKNEGAIKAMQYRAVRSLARVLPKGWEW